MSDTGNNNRGNSIQKHISVDFFKNNEKNYSNSQSTDIIMEEEEEINEKLVSNIFRNCFGEKIGDAIELAVLNPCSKLLQLDKRKHFGEKFARVSVLILQFTISMILLIAIFSYFSAFPLSKEALTQFSLMIVCFLFFFIMIMMNMIKPETETITIVLTSFSITCLIAFVLCYRNVSIFLGGIHNILAFILFIIFFTLKNSVIKFLAIVSYSVIICGLLVYDFIMKNRVTDEVCGLIKESYETQLFTTYLFSHSTVLLMVVIFYFKSTSEKSFLIKMITFVKNQNKNIDLENQKISLKINEDLFNIDSSNIEILSEIGIGGSECKIFKAYYNDQTVAFKRFQAFSLLNEEDSNVLFQQEMDNFQQEIKLLKEINHPNIIQYFGATIDKNGKRGLVMEYCSNGDIIKYITKRKKKGHIVSIKDKYVFIIQISSAMKFVHSKDVCHRDIKPQNILISKDAKVKLIDFGLGKRISEKKQHTFCGTTVYMAPEVFKKGEYDKSCDIYSFGIVLYLILHETRYPYDRNRNAAKKASNSPNFRPNISKRFSGKIFSECISIMKKCWSHNPEERPNFNSIYDNFRKMKKDLETDSNDE